MLIQEIVLEINFRPFSDNVKPDVRLIHFEIYKDGVLFKAVPKCTSNEKSKLSISDEILFTQLADGSFIANSSIEKWLVDKLSKML